MWIDNVFIWCALIFSRFRSLFSVFHSTHTHSLSLSLLFVYLMSSIQMMTLIRALCNPPTHAQSTKSSSTSILCRPMLNPYGIHYVRICNALIAISRFERMRRVTAAAYKRNHISTYHNGFHFCCQWSDCYAVAVIYLVSLFVAAIQINAFNSNLVAFCFYHTI